MRLVQGDRVAELESEMALKCVIFVKLCCSCLEYPLSIDFELLSQQLGSLYNSRQQSPHEYIYNALKH